MPKRLRLYLKELRERLYGWSGVRNGWMDGWIAQARLGLCAACFGPVPDLPPDLSRPMGDCLAAWTLAWEDSTPQVLTVAHGGDRSNDIARSTP